MSFNSTYRVSNNNGDKHSLNATRVTSKTTELKQARYNRYGTFCIYAMPTEVNSRFHGVTEHIVHCKGRSQKRAFFSNGVMYDKVECDLPYRPFWILYVYKQPCPILQIEGYFYLSSYFTVRNQANISSANIMLDIVVYDPVWINQEQKFEDI